MLKEIFYFLHYEFFFNELYPMFQTFSELIYVNIFATYYHDI